MPDEAPPASPPDADSTPAGDPPPAAYTVTHGKAREESLAAELDAERAARKEAEHRASSLENDYRRMKEIQTLSDPAATKRAFLSGATFFHGAD